jgi:hypothetical protein
MALLTQFLFRASFGLALSMALTSPRQVTSGYFRNHLYVLLGLNVLAASVAFSAPSQFAWWPPLTAAIISYVGAVCWLYEKPRPGIIALALVAGTTLIGAWLATDWSRYTTGAGRVLEALDPLTSGLLLGSTLAAMFLGHWYLNTPTMVMAPLERLIVLMAGALLLRAVVCAVGLAFQVVDGGPLSSSSWLFILLRWLAGLLGAAGLTWMTWKTLRIPNTQSATGILYVAVLATFLGELTAMLLSTDTSYPI